MGGSWLQRDALAVGQQPPAPCTAAGAQAARGAEAMELRCCASQHGSVTPCARLVSCCLPSVTEPSRETAWEGGDGDGPGGAGRASPEVSVSAGHGKQLRAAEGD